MYNADRVRVMQFRNGVLFSELESFIPKECDYESVTYDDDNGIERCCSLTLLTPSTLYVEDGQILAVEQNCSVKVYDEKVFAKEFVKEFPDR